MQQSQQGHTKLEQTNKYILRKREIAEATLSVMSAHGYAQTNLREIAKTANVSLGALHYYFVNKSDLLTYCVRHYKMRFVENINSFVESADDFDKLVTGFANQLALSCENDPHSHRLWYDIRSQALFSQEFSNVVNEINESLLQMILLFVRRAEELSTKKVLLPDRFVYPLFDGIFQTQLLSAIEQDPVAAATQLKQDILSCCKILFQTDKSATKISG